MVSPARLAHAGLAAALALAASPALAQTPAAKAERLFLDARAALDRGDFAGGCPKLEESLKLVERPGTLLNLAECAEHDKHPALALARVERALALLPPSDERSAFAKKRQAELTPRTALLVVSAGAEVIVELDGKPAPRASLEALRVDPGRHVVTFVGAGGVRREIELAVEAGERKAVAAPREAGPALPPGEPPPPPPASGSGRRTAGFVIGGLGVGGLVAAGVTGGLILSRKSSIDAECPKMKCSPEGRQLIDGTKGLFIGNGVAWGVGLAGVAAGAILVITAPRGEARVSVSPSAYGAHVALEREF